MEIWETDAAKLGGEAELDLQGAGWEPFGVVYVPVSDDARREGYPAVLYRRKKEGLREEML